MKKNNKNNLGGFPPDDDDVQSDFDTSFDISEFEVGQPPLTEAPPPREIIDQCREFFSPGGTLSNATFGGAPPEPRPQQVAMALAVAESIVNGTHACVEAPTGVGKSFAYLVPLIIRAQYCRRAAVISTDTIHLQEQLIEKDVPFLRELMKLNFSAAIAKGRRNYICLRRLEMLSGEQRDALLPMPSLVVDLEQLNNALKRGTDGNRDSFGFRVSSEIWNLVCCDPIACQGRKCPNFSRCYYQRARKSWEEADIIIANHALFFTDLAMKNCGATSGTLLPNYGVAIIDEAHTLENQAAKHLGTELSKNGVLSMLNRLFNHEKNRGLLMRQGAAMLALRSEVVAAREDVYGYFAPFEKLLREGEKAKALPNDVDFPDTISRHFADIAVRLGEIAETEEDASIKTELLAYKERCAAIIDEVATFTERESNDIVYYAESGGRDDVELHAAPLNVAELLKEQLFNRDFPVVLCSATLTVRRSFNYYASRVGFEGRFLMLDSPFSPNQAKLYVPSDIPAPDDPNHMPALIKAIRHYVGLTQGKAFVLFTSYQAMQKCAEELRDEFNRNGWHLLEQGENLSRTAMLNEFKRDIDSVLFGTDSFWTGVDVPGKALTEVIITRLPFASPGHPLTAARMRKIEETGGSSFFLYSLPEAVLKFRQGVGRLIRSQRDRGYIIVLDKRLLSKSYGRTFLESIPYPLQGK